MRQRWIRLFKSQYSPLAALVLIFGFAVLISAVAQALAVPAPALVQEEEEEDPPKKANNTEVEEEDEDFNPLIKRAYGDITGGIVEKPKVDVARVVSLKKLAKETKHYAPRRMFERLQIPHDEMTFQGLGGVGGADVVHWIEPLTAYVGDQPDVNLQSAIEIQMIDARSGKAIGKKLLRSPKNMKAVLHYEALALEQIKVFRKLCADPGLGKEPFAKLQQGDPLHLSDTQQLLAVEQALSFVHAFVKQEHAKSRREGAGWEDLQRKLEIELRDVILARLDAVIRGGDWSGALELAKQTALRFPDPGDRNAIVGRLRTMMRRKLINPADRDQAFREVYARVRILQEAFPTATFDDVLDDVDREAVRLLKLAQVLEKQDKRSQVRAILDQVQAISPGSTREAEMRAGLAKDILNVGVRRQPIYLSPSHAWSDAEKQALELMFESLVELSPDSTVVRYRPALAQGRPRLTYLGRKFYLPPYLRWSDGKELTHGDVEHTIDLLRNDKRLGYNPTWAKQLIQGARVDQNPYEMTVHLKQGYFDPLSLMTFKILQHDTDDDRDFAKQPIGSGPYRFEDELSAEGGRKYLSFRANPFFARRQRGGGLPLPHVQEIRFFETSKPVEELKNGSLHLLLDLNAAEVEEVKRDAGTLFVTPPLPSRRIHFLAVNHRKSDALANAKFRLALAHAVNRQAILNEHFRKGLTGDDAKAHHVLNGPYPADSWAYDQELRGTRLHNAGLALRRLNEAKEELGRLPGVSISLIYPAGDARVEAAMQRIHADVTKALEGKVQLKLEALQPADVRKRVLERDYHLAYFHHDYADYTFWLWPLLDPRAATGNGSNYLGYKSSGAMPAHFRIVMEHRDFSKIREATHRIHRLFTETEMPFIPLWQLDRFVAFRRELELHTADGEAVELGQRRLPFPIDPLRIFCDVEHWTLKPKGP